MDGFDLAMLLLRLVFGASLVAHGMNKVRGPRGLRGTADWFASIGMRQPHLQARAASGTEITAGILLVLGLLTPLASAATVGLMTVAIVTVHWKVGYFIFLPQGGWEYCAAFATVAVALGCAGPGRVSLDHALGITVAGPGGGAVALGGLGVALIQLIAFYRRPPRA